MDNPNSDVQYNVPNKDGVTIETNGSIHVNINLDLIRANKIFVATPMYGGACFGPHAKSVTQFVALCQRHDIEVHVHNYYNESLVQRARNYLVDDFMRSGYKHFIFIDADIEFRGDDILSMLHLQNVNTDYDVICGAYPKKSIMWSDIKAAVNAGFVDDDANRLEDFVGDYVFNTDSGGNVSLLKPFRVSEAGTGFMAVRREVFEKFAIHFPEQAYFPDHRGQANFDGSRKIYAYFDCVIDRGNAPRKKEALIDLIMSGATDVKLLKKKAQEIRKIEEKSSLRYLSEDYFFCRKIAEFGAKIWIVPWIQLKHHGYFVYGGSLNAKGALSNVMAQQGAQPK